MENPNPLAPIPTSEPPPTATSAWTWPRLAHAVKETIYFLVSVISLLFILTFLALSYYGQILAKLAPPRTVEGFIIASPLDAVRLSLHSGPEAEPRQVALEPTGHFAFAEPGVPFRLRLDLASGQTVRVIVKRGGGWKSIQVSGPMELQ